MDPLEKYARAWLLEYEYLQAMDAREDEALPRGEDDRWARMLKVKAEACDALGCKDYYDAQAKVFSAFLGR
jgi:hypothetical protein